MSDKLPPFTPYTHCLFQAMSEQNLHAGTKDLILYVLHHSRGRNNPQVRLSAEEFINGRKYASGKRYDSGTSLKSRNGVAQAIKEAKDAHILIVLDIADVRDVKAFRIADKYLTCSDSEHMEDTSAVSEHIESPEPVVPAHSVSISSAPTEHIPAQIVSMPSAVSEQVTTRQPAPAQAPATPKETLQEPLLETHQKTLLQPPASPSAGAPTSRRANDGIKQEEEKKTGDDDWQRQSQITYFKDCIARFERDLKKLDDNPAWRTTDHRTRADLNEQLDYYRRELKRAEEG